MQLIEKLAKQKTEWLNAFKETYQENRNVLKSKKDSSDEVKVIHEIINNEFNSGKTYREIGSLLNLDYSTIAFHRRKFLENESRHKNY